MVRSKTYVVIAVGAALGLGVVVLLGAYWMAHTRGVHFGVLAYDSTSVLDAPVYVGSISRFNMMVWSAVGAQAVLVAILWRAVRLPMLGFGAVTLLMAADDALRLHEGVGPRLGIPEIAWYVLYAAVAVAILAWFVRRWSAAGVVYLIGAALLGVSVLSDVIGQDDLDVVHNGLVLLEDGSKLLGSLVWATLPAIVALEHRRAARDVEPYVDGVPAGEPRGN